jgi:hypothetical protein
MLCGWSLTGVVWLSNVIAVVISLDVLDGSSV